MTFLLHGKIKLIIFFFSSSNFYFIWYSLNLQFALIKKETKKYSSLKMFFGIHESSISSLALPRRSN
ncbi:hypothetical protein B6A10_03050 [Flavobacterium sp. L1I52]|uniref:Uncharacterized protein n=1 Tax=Flavobacterium pokkalii TaxID=1940408 RepID=A0ABR7UN35_9FLAO|nr:hypothetical protein [Flavobacterium pokkalii]